MTRPPNPTAAPGPPTTHSARPSGRGGRDLVLARGQGGGATGGSQAQDLSPLGRPGHRGRPLASAYAELRDATARAFVPVLTERRATRGVRIPWERLPRLPASFRSGAMSKVQAGGRGRTESTGVACAFSCWGPRNCGPPRASPSMSAGAGGGPC
ncbi:three-helix bundle dimerization domain-containing protein [Kitasatospora sp. NPDC059408]|uniref:three-helix bundle dimerization domain-containing protein n=1 Tax=Kitasatospora sp. NPDC059408 TaxID=3346823 RepID=UPI0036B12C0F